MASIESSQSPHTQSPYTKWLSDAYEVARRLVDVEDVESAIAAFISAQPELRHPLMAMKDGQVTLLEKTVAEGARTLVGNFAHNKYLYSILLTGLVEKLVHPERDIRNIQDDMGDGVRGYSNRSTDQAYVTPFLKRHGLTHCAASGMESGRNLERPIPHRLDLRTKPRGKGNREAYLGLVHAVQIDGVEPFPIMALLMALDLATKMAQTFTYESNDDLTIEEIHGAVLRHHREAMGNGKSRLPVLALQAVYQCLTEEMARYTDAKLRTPPNRHTGNDKKGWIGDVQVDNLDGTPFEAVEVKSGKQITGDMLRKLPDVFRGQSVDRYYILSNEETYIEPGQEGEIKTLVAQIKHETGCQVIVNGLNRSLWYYLRLVNDPSEFLTHYTDLVAHDPDVQPQHQQLWSEILVTLSNMQETLED